MQKDRKINNRKININVIFINVETRQVTEILIKNQLEAFYKILQCKLVETAYGIVLEGTNHVMLVDEEGLLKTPLGAFQCFDLPPISGNALILSLNKSGEFTDCKIELDTIRAIVSFRPISELPEPTIRFYPFEI